MNTNGHRAQAHVGGNNIAVDVILQAIGRKKQVKVALDAIELEDGDALLLCTDGLSEKVQPADLGQALRANETNRKLFEANRARIEEDNADRRTEVASCAAPGGSFGCRQVRHLRHLLGQPHLLQGAWTVARRIGMQRPDVERQRISRDERPRAEDVARTPAKGRGTVWAIEHRYARQTGESYDDGWGTVHLTFGLTPR